MMAKNLGEFRKKSKAELPTFTDEKKFSTFTGVYRPTILTILGLIMYLRQGWVVGNAGLMGMLLIIAFSFAITGITAASIAVIISNTRIGKGGVFSLVSQSLGLQVGGSIGVPLYLAQGVSAPFYIFGFAEGWAFLFPEHPQTVVLITMFFVATLLSALSAKLAFRAQIVVLLGVVAALLSIFLGLLKVETFAQPVLWGGFEEGSFWRLFSIYFPAATGVMVGASMSGNLYNPKRSIPLGTFAAWGTALTIYVALSFWYAFVADGQTLRADNQLSISRAYVPTLVVIGILSSCFSATLSSMVVAPRVLQAMGDYGILPGSSFFKKTFRGEPLYASLVTMAIIFFILMVFDGIDAIAPFVTQFFIIIFFIINSVLAIEQQLGLLSFRPSFSLPKVVPILGSILCASALIIVSPLIGVISILLVVLLYAYFSARKISNPFETVQSGLFLTLAEWGVRKAILAGVADNRRSWKPDVLTVFHHEQDVKNHFFLIRSIIASRGSLRLISFPPVKKGREKKKRGLRFRLKSARQWQTKLLIKAIPSKNAKSIAPNEDKKGTKQKISKNKSWDSLNALQKKLVKQLIRKGTLASQSVILAEDPLFALEGVLSFASNSFLSPNSLYVPIGALEQDDLWRLSQMTLTYNVALILASSKNLLTRASKEIVLWVRDQTPNWELSLNLSNLDYAILLAYQLREVWDSNLTLRCVATREEHVASARQYLMELIELSRIGQDVRIDVKQGSFVENLAANRFSTGGATTHIFGLDKSPDIDSLRNIESSIGGNALFVRDSGTGKESALV